MERNPTDIINDLLHLDLSPTVRGDEVKGYCPDPNKLGEIPLCLGRAECEVLSNAFAKLAKELMFWGT